MFQHMLKTKHINISSADDTKCGVSSTRRIEDRPENARRLMLVIGKLISEPISTH
jgi:hypothetical protein